MANAAETASVIEQVGNVFDPGKMSGYLDIVMELAIQYGLKLIAAVAIFIIGKMVANWIKKLVIRFMKKSNEIGRAHV